MLHPLYSLLLNGPVSADNEPIKKIPPMFDLLMMIPPADEVVEDEDLAAIWGSTVGVLYVRHN